jgi:hypothetical protein
VCFARADHSGGGCISQAGTDHVKGVSLDDLIGEFGPIDLLKIDIEGAEYEVLEAAQRLGDVHEIVAELHVDSRDDHRVDKLADFLSSSGFEVSITSEAELYGHEALRRVLSNRRALSRQFMTKILCTAYLLAPFPKPIRAPNATYDLPILTARRRS